jgi:hypothetical protein
LVEGCVLVEVVFDVDEAFGEEGVEFGLCVGAELFGAVFGVGHVTVWA